MTQNNTIQENSNFIIVQLANEENSGHKSTSVKIMVDNPRRTFRPCENRRLKRP